MSDDLTRAKQHPLHELVQSWGVRLTKGATGNYWRGKCPLHEDKSPSFSIVKHADGQYSWKCHAGCGHGTIVDLLMMREGLAKAAAIARSLEVAGIERSTGGGRRMEFGAAAAPAAAAVATVTARAPLSDEWLKVLHDATERVYNLKAPPDSLKRYGLSIEAAAEAGLGLDQHGNVLIPLRSFEGALQQIKLRSKDPEGSPRYRYLARGQGSPAWISPNFQPSSPNVLVVEGELNAIAAYTAISEAGARLAVLGMPGAESGLTAAFDGTLEGRNVYVYSDDDPAGDKARQRWALEAQKQGAAKVAMLKPLGDGIEDYAAFLRDAGPRAVADSLLADIAEAEREAAQLEPIPAATDDLGFVVPDLAALVQPAEWMVEGMFQAGKINLLAAYGGVGKSALAAYLIVCCLTGRHDFLGRMAYKHDEILYVDYEDDEGAFRANIKRAASGLGVDPSEISGGIRYVAAPTAGWGPFGGMVDRVAAYIQQRPGLKRALILDSFEASMQIDSVKAVEVMAAMAAIKRLVNQTDITVLALDHLPKVGKGQSKDDLMPAGSVQKTNQSRAVVKVEDVTPVGYGDGRSLLRVVAVKINNAKRFDPFGVERVFDRGSVRYALAELPEPEMGGRAPERREEALTMLVEELNKHGAMPRSKLVGALGERRVAHRTAHRAISQALQQEIVEEVMGMLRLLRRAN